MKIAEISLDLNWDNSIWSSTSSSSGSSDRNNKAIIATAMSQSRALCLELSPHMLWFPAAFHDLQMNYKKTTFFCIDTAAHGTASVFCIQVILSSVIPNTVKLS